MKERQGSAQQAHGQRKRRGDRAGRPNPALQAAVLEIVDTQLREGDPPQTQQTFDRLIAAGYPATDVRRLLACAVVSEIFDVLQRGQPYDEARYVAALQRLPMLPWEE